MTTRQRFIECIARRIQVTERTDDFLPVKWTGILWGDVVEHVAKTQGFLEYYLEMSDNSYKYMIGQVKTRLKLTRR